MKVDENKNIFLNIPLYGDLKLAVNIKNRTTDVVIDYISQVRLRIELTSIAKQTINLRFAITGP